MLAVREDMFDEDAQWLSVVVQKMERSVEARNTLGGRRVGRTSCGWW